MCSHFPTNLYALNRYVLFVHSMFTSNVNHAHLSYVPYIDVHILIVISASSSVTSVLIHKCVQGTLKM